MILSKEDWKKVINTNDEVISIVAKLVNEVDYWQSSAKQWRENAMHQLLSFREYKQEIENKN